MGPNPMSQLRGDSGAQAEDVPKDVVVLTRDPQRVEPLAHAGFAGLRVFALDDTNPDWVEVESSYDMVVVQSGAGPAPVLSAWRELGSSSLNESGRMALDLMRCCSLLTVRPRQPAYKGATRLSRYCWTGWHQVGRLS